MVMHSQAKKPASACYDLVGEKWSIPEEPLQNVRYIYQDIAQGGKDCVRTKEDYGEQGDRGMYTIPRRNGVEPTEVGRDISNAPFMIDNPWKNQEGVFDFDVKQTVLQMKEEDEAYHKVVKNKLFGS